MTGLQKVRDSAVAMARDPFRVMLVVLIVMDVSRIHQQFPVLKAARPALAVTALVLIIAWLKPALLAKRPLLETRNAKLIAAFGVFACISAVFGISFGNSALFLLNDYVKTIIFAFLIIVSIRDTRDLHTIIMSYVISSLWLIIAALFIFKVSQYKGYQRLSNLATYDANDLGLVLIFGLALTMLVFQTGKFRTKIFAGIIIVGIGGAIAKSGSRGALVGLAAFGIGLLVLLNSVAIGKRVLFMVVTVAAMAVFAPPGYLMQMSTIFDPTHDYNYNSPSGRRAVALRGIGYWKAYPIFGVGIHNFQKAECFISDKALTHEVRTGLWCQPPHNAYIEALAELGTPGIVLWLLMIPGSVVALVILRNRMPRHWATGTPEERYLYLTAQYLAVGILGYSAGSFFLSFAWIDVTYYVSAVTAGLYIAVAEKRERDARGQMTGPVVVARPQSGWRARPVPTPVPAPALPGRRNTR